ncbi:MAG: hypothetical protein IPI28_03330 [Candidatus Omnitrophica bacterium]|nr:hypothetical protein [Candidatus Omnitrophota bacterium]
MWLGHKWGWLPKHEWDPDRYFRFRKYYDYSGGIATDLFYHKLAPFMVPFDNELPKRVTASGGIYLFPDREVPDNSFVLVDYPSKHTIAILASMTNDTGVSDRIYGQKGTIDLLSDDKIKITGQKESEEEFKAANNGQMEVEIQGDPRPNHRKNFLDAVREGADLNLDAARGYAAQVAISLSLYAFRQGKTLSWSEEKGVMHPDPMTKGSQCRNEAARFPQTVRKALRPEGWHQKLVEAEVTSFHRFHEEGCSSLHPSIFLPMTCLPRLQPETRIAPDHPLIILQTSDRFEDHTAHGREVVRVWKETIPKTSSDTAEPRWRSAFGTTNNATRHSLASSMKLKKRVFQPASSLPIRMTSMSLIRSMWKSCFRNIHR